MTKIRIVFWTACFFVMACSKAADPTTDALVGTWTGSCIAGSRDTTYAKFTLTLAADSTMTQSAEMYSAAGCAAAAKVYTFNYTGTWVKGDAVTGIDGAFNVDSTYNKVEMSLHSDANVTSFNTAGACGGGWVKDTPKELTATAASCTGFPKSGDKNYDIFKVDGTKLYYGSSAGGKDGKSAANRATTLDTTAWLDKQS